MDAATSVREYDSNGWFEIPQNPLSKVGVFPYIGSMIDHNGSMGLDPAAVYWVFRSAKELSDPDTIESFKNIPWIDGHTMLGDGPGLTSPDAVGVKGIIGEQVFFRDDTVYGNIKLFSDQLSDGIDDGSNAELSCGYRCKYRLQSGTFGDKPYTVVQEKIRGNHVASIAEGRMGPEVCVLDENFTFTIDAKDFKPMAQKTRKQRIADILADDSIGTDQAIKDIRLIMGAKGMDAEPDADMSEKFTKDEPGPSDGKPSDGKPSGSDDDDDEKGKGADMDDDEKGKGEDDKDDDEKGKGEDDKDDDEKKVAASASDSKLILAMDAKIKRIETSFDKRLAAHKRDGYKNFLKQAARKDALYGRVSELTGAFAADEMTEQEVAAYACDHLKLTPSKGHEVAAIEGYLAAKPAARKGGFGLTGAISSGLDSKSRFDPVFGDLFSGKAAKAARVAKAN